jgi:hypothetical protein
MSMVEISTMDLKESDNLSNRDDTDSSGLNCVSDAENDKACLNKCTQNKSFKVPLKRRHSTGALIMETESNSCKNGEQFSQNYSKKIYKLSRQFSHENFIQNIDAIKCSRFFSRRNALCDPFRMLIPQQLREQLEHNVERRKTSVTRKVV